MKTITPASLALAIAVASLSNAVAAQEFGAPSEPVRHWIPIDPARLAQMRGGLQLPSGLSVSFGIERLVYLNGELIAGSRLTIPDVSHITPEQAQALAAINRGQVVQVGPNNRFESPGAGGLVIQNTLDGQDIRSITTLEVGVGTLDMFQQLNAADALSRAQSLSPGGL